MNKQQIVDGLKKNERAYAFLSANEKEVLRHINNKELKCLYADQVDIEWNSNIYDGYSITKPAIVWRIKEEYKLPIEAPEGYRLVTDEERADHSLKHQAFKVLKMWDLARWRDVAGIGGSTRWDNTTPYAVPVDFRFNSIKVEANGKTVYISKESAEQLGL